MVSIDVDKVWVEFPVYNANSRSLKKKLLQAGMGGIIRLEEKRPVIVQALRDVSLNIGPGDRLGIVGRNGAGKTTLLRVLAGIYEPTQGMARSIGKVAPMFDTMMGMKPEATGMDNIHLLGLYLGFSPRVLRDKMSQIAEFTELGDYLLMPVRTYSSGMRLRLAFSVWSSIAADILLLDEWINVGDVHFVAKAREQMNAFVGRSSLLVLASHSNELIREVCNKAILLQQGEIVMAGGVDEVLAKYGELG